MCCLGGQRYELCNRNLPPCPVDCQIIGVDRPQCTLGLSDVGNSYATVERGLCIAWSRVSQAHAQRRRRLSRAVVGRCPRLARQFPSSQEVLAIRSATWTVTPNAQPTHLP